MPDNDTRKPGDPDRTVLRLVNWQPGDRVGPYKVLEKLGEGGMGVVYLAEQVLPIRRKVALKIVKLGLDLDQVVARFESERQALAMMEHPSIAEIHDAGATPEGLPYFVMEYVPGTSLTRHCDDHKLSLRERLELFIPICEAVQHAHQKAIIHRDLKPTNILVTTQDGRTVPKIIDFGLAKTLAQPLTDKTIHTGLGQLLGTPKYMSPEQADLARQNVDTRTDVYSLGGVLYELLVGAAPLEAHSLTFEEMLKVIRDQEPVRPSRKLVEMDQAEAEEVAARRSTDVATLHRQLRGDLDWITTKALEKERNRRYNSAADLAADIQRYLSDRPVVARPPTLAYRTRKFTRRHRLAVGALASILILTVMFGFFLARQARRVVMERDRANLEAETTRQVAQFLTDLFKISDPMIAQGYQPTAREILDQGAEKIGTALADRPLVQARLLRTMASAYENLGLYGKAEPLYRAALENQTRLLGAGHAETIDTLGELAGLQWRRGQFNESEAGLLKTLDAKKRLLGNENPSTLRVVNNLANLYMVRGMYQKAEDMYRSAFETRRRVQGESHPDTLGAANNLANVIANQNRMEEAEKLYVWTLEGRRRIQGENHPDSLGAASNLAEHYSMLRRYPEAEKLHLDVLERRRRILGPEHPDTLTSMSNLGEVYRRSGRLAEAEPYLTAGLEGRRKAFGPGHREVVLSTFYLGSLRRAQNRLPEAEALLTQASNGWIKLFGDDHPYVFKARDGLARVKYARKDYQGAELVFREILEGQRKSQASGELVDTLFNLACVNALQSDRNEALGFLKEVVAAGFEDPEAFKDPDLASLRNEAEFQDLVRQVKSTQLAKAE